MNKLIQALYRLVVRGLIIPEKMIAPLLALGLIDSGGEAIKDVGDVVKSYVKPMGYQEPYELDEFKESIAT